MSAKADKSFKRGTDLPPSAARSHPSRAALYLRRQQALVDYPARLTDSLHHWAAVVPDRLFMAERAADGGWRKITYAELLEQSRRIASGLLMRDLSAERP